VLRLFEGQALFDSVGGASIGQSLEESPVSWKTELLFTRSFLYLSSNTLFSPLSSFDDTGWCRRRN